MRVSRLLIVGSALMYGAAFIWSATLGWLLIPALLLLEVLFVQRGISFSAALLWTGIAFALRTFDLFYAVRLTAGVAWYLIVLIGLLFWLYVVAQAAVLLWALCVVRSKRLVLNVRARTALSLWFVMVMVLFHWWLGSGLFWAFGAFEGEATANPLVPLCCWAKPWLRGTQPPQFLDRMVVGRLPFRPLASVDPVIQTQALGGVVHRTLVRYPRADVILFPESTLPFSVNANESACILLNQLSRNRNLLFGGHRLGADGDVFSSFYWAHDGILTVCHDKSHLIFFTERAPELFGLHLPETLNQACGCEDVFACGVGARKPFHLGFDCACSSLLCSELFMTSQCASVPENTLSIVLANDAWFSGSAQPDLLWGVAFFKSWWYSKPMIYVAYHHASYFDGNGHWFALHE